MRQRSRYGPVGDDRIAHVAVGEPRARAGDADAYRSAGWDPRSGTAPSAGPASRSLRRRTRPFRRRPSTRGTGTAGPDTWRAPAGISSRPKSCPSSRSRISSITRRENTYTPIDAMNGCSSVCVAKVAPAGMLRPISFRRSAFGFSSNATIWPPVSKRKIPIWVAVAGIHRLRGNGDVGLCVLVRLDQLLVVHPVEVIAGEDEVVVGLVLRVMPDGLAYRVGGALIPVRVVGRLLGGEDLDEPAGEPVELIGVRNVTVERRGIELRQHEDATDAGVQAAADRDVNEAVLAADRHRRLRSRRGERKQPGALASAKDDGKRIAGHDRHGECKAAAVSIRRGREARDVELEVAVRLR